MLLLMVLRLILLLIVMLLARLIRLRLAWSERLAADVRLLAVAVVFIGPAHLAGLLLLLVVGLALAELLLCRRDDAEIVLGVLIVIFRRDGIAGALRVTGELKVLFGDVGRGSANFHVRPAGLIHPR